jgi:hypothetical protein
MPRKSGEHTLEFLLGFNGHVHRYAGGYWLLDDFFDEVERVLTEHGIPFEVIEVTEGDSP